MPASSTTPLPRKLGLRESSRLLLINPPGGFVALLEPLPLGLKIVDTGNDFDVAVVFAGYAAELGSLFAPLARRLRQGAYLWLAWPKKASAVQSDLSFTLCQQAGLDAGLVDSKKCSLDDTWSGLRFTRRRDRR